MTAVPFTIDVPQAVLDDLQRRLQATRWIDDLNDPGWSHGLSIPYMRELVAYWHSAFDWRAQEDSLNGFPNFRTDVKGGQIIHFIHEQGKGPDPLPIILTHGFPDSVLRFAKLIPMLADPAAYGGDPADAFHVVAPSLPGYGFSDKPHDGTSLFQVGDMWHDLMTRVLGYDHYVAHGGDWGSTITDFLARDHSDAVLAIHLTDVPFYHALAGAPTDPSRAERDYLDFVAKFQPSQGAYAFVQGAQPQVVATGLNDSPAGLAAWIVEKFRRWSDCDGDVERAFTKDELLANVMLYWVTQTINSSFLPYYDVTQAGAMTWLRQKLNEWKGSDEVPAAFAMFPKDLSSPPREWAARFYNVQRWTPMPHGGHFAALEEPDLLANDLRTFFRPFRGMMAAMRSELFKSGD
ncbi:MAG TPA: epoxide hydrolase [Gemmatimonadaceae bacterium]|nr:epoxide hydrolase [Gemmatimonadaceae bacterium]